MVSNHLYAPGACHGTAATDYNTNYVVFCPSFFCSGMASCSGDVDRRDPGTGQTHSPCPFGRGMTKPLLGAPPWCWPYSLWWCCWRIPSSKKQPVASDKRLGIAKQNPLFRMHSLGCENTAGTIFQRQRHPPTGKNQQRASYNALSISFAMLPKWIKSSLGRVLWGSVSLRLRGGGGSVGRVVSWTICHARWLVSRPSPSARRAFYRS